MLEVERINYSIPSKDEDVSETLTADDVATVDEVVAAAATWQFKDVLTADECDRLALINKLLSQQLRGKIVSTQNLKKALTADEYADYESSLREPISTHEILYADGVPKELKRYNLMLRDADFQYYKYEKMAGLKSVGRATYKHDTLSKTYNKSEHLYEHALEYLEEQIVLSQQNREGDRLTRWLDRDVVFGPNGNTRIQADGVPRVKGSRSHEALDAALPKMSVRLKRQQRVLENLLRAAVACAYVPEVVEVKQDAVKIKLPDFSHLFSERD